MQTLGHLSVPYARDLRNLIAATLPPAMTTARAVCVLDNGIGHAFAGVASRALHELCGGAADLVVSHGQTMYHWVADDAVRGSLQLGQPAWIAEVTGVPVISDLRSRDVAAGGQGAPLVGMTDTLLLRGLPGVPAALNLGGIANITVLAPGADPLAFDTGPANALLDAATGHFTGGNAAYDEDGRRAAAGQTSPDLLKVLLDDPYYRRAAPKTTGKEHFHLPYLRACAVRRADSRSGRRPRDPDQAHGCHRGRRLPSTRSDQPGRVRRRYPELYPDAHDRRGTARPGTPAPARARRTTAAPAAHHRPRRLTDHHCRRRSRPLGAQQGENG